MGQTGLFGRSRDGCRAGVKACSEIFPFRFFLGVVFPFGKCCSGSWQLRRGGGWAVEILAGAKVAAGFHAVDGASPRLFFIGFCHGATRPGANGSLARNALPPAAAGGHIRLPGSVLLFQLPLSFDLPLSFKFFSLRLNFLVPSCLFHLFG